ncbi:hypothetical protein scyTo_0001885 [Scyliorhinus torazame]|uniref:Doublecortin domain-containing protein n=1 Tax=Scyliorhinus torazame TaxID=75743 RepID=A0A401PGK4_SCYTO|nr:hypothetical protein [Scyliorhinus torazame]
MYHFLFSDLSNRTKMNKASLRYSAIFPFNFEEPLSSVAKTTNLTEVTPAKKITFYKSGDPQLTGVKMTVNKRAFKTFDALLDDLSQKISLPFAVRTVTTPHGVHGINSLEQLEDGGSYICSHKKHVKPISAGKVTWQGQKPISPRRHSTRRERQEDSHAHHTQMAHKNIILIKNGNVGIHYSIVLHKRNTYSFRGFLGEISELMQYSVRKIYTMDGTNIDTLQALFHCPGVLVCVGHETFKPILNEKFRRRLSERMPGLSRRSRADVNNESDDMKRNVNFGLEAKKSVIHPRSPSRSSRFSISADKSYTKGSNMSSSNSGYASFADSLPHKKDGELMNSVIDDDIEKKVHVNKDGSLSLEMKVRFRLLNRETLQWSTQIRKSGFARKTRNEHLSSVEDFVMEQDDQRNTDNGFDGSVDPCNADDFYVSKLDCTEPEENHCENCKYDRGYDIWKNPMYAGQVVKANSGNGTYTQSSFSGPSPYQKAAYQRKSAESIQTISSEEYSQHFVQQMENHSETVEDGEGGIEYCSVSHCSSQSGSFTSASKNGGYRKGSQSSPEILGINDELHLPNNDTNGRPVSNTTYSSSKKSNKHTKNMDANEGSTCSVPSCLSTSSAAQMMTSSLIAGKGGYVLCAENINEKKRVKPTTSIQSEQSSLSDHTEIVTNSVNKSKKFSNSKSLKSSSCRSKKVKSEDECRLPTSASGNSDPNVEVGEEGKTSNEDNTPALDPSDFSEVLQIEDNIKMECERCEKAHSICLIVSKASRDKAAAKSQEQVDQTNISKLSNPAELELLPCKIVEDTMTHTNSITEDASVEGRPQSFVQRGMAGGESTRQLLMDPALQSKSIISTDKVTGCKPPASRPTTSTCNLSDESTTDKPHKENGIKSDSSRSSEKVNSKETFKVNNNNKKNKNKKSTFTSTVACGKIDLIPGVLPDASFEDIVHEWLKKIPSENMLVKYDNTEEFQDKCEKSATDVIPGGGKSETEALTTLDGKPYGVESTVGNQGSKEKHDLMMVKLESSGSLMAEAKSSGQEVVQEADALLPKPVSSCCSGLTTTNQLHEKVLRNNVHSSIEAIKVLLSSGQRAKLDRSNSLPSLNLTLKSKLSHSAKALLTCLASVQFFDKESLDSENKLIKTNNSAQKELLSILKSLWFTDIMIEDVGEVSQTSGKHSKTFKGHNSADDNVTPLSSSGVDINSGSGGSGDGSMGGVTDAPPTGEKKNGNLYLQTYTNKKDDASKQNQPSLMKNISDENSEIRIEQNKKNEDYSISSAGSPMTDAPCRKPKRRNWNGTNKSEDNDNIDKRSLSRASEVSQSDVAPSSPVTPDIACRVQWSSGDQSEDLDEIIDSNTRKCPQDTNQNLKEQSASVGEGMKPLAGASCDLEEIVHRTKTQGQNGTVDVNYSEEDKIVHNKITEKCDNIGIIKAPQQITSGHCCAAQAVKPGQEPEPTKRKSFNPDPFWLTKLLKKMEMQFIADYVDAMNEFKIRWNLEADDRLDQMIEDLSEDIRRRIQESVERELKKVQCRAGRNKPSPPQEPRRSESSEQTEQRRKRLKAMYKMQTFTPHSNEPDHEHNTKDFSSLISDEELTFCAMFGDNSDSHEQFSPDKFCPCDSFTEKSKTPKPVKNAMQTNIPIVKDFDLREILRMKMSRPNEQIKKHIADANGPEELLDRKTDKQDSGESESMELVENKIKNVIQNDEPVNLNQENIDVNNECQNHKLDGMFDQGEEQLSTGNHVVGLNLEDIDENKQVNESKDEDKSEDGKSRSVTSENALEPNEDEEGDVYRVENEHKNGKEENDYTEYNNEVTNIRTEEYKEQDEENNMLCNNTDPEMENNNKLEELLSVDSQQVYEMSGNNVRYTVENNSKEVHEAKHLNNNVSELSDILVKSNVIKSRNEEVVETMNTKLPLEQSDSLDVNSCPQRSDEGMPENSAKEGTEGDNQIDTKEAISSSSNSPGNKSSQMYPQSSSDEDTKSNCTGPEAPENEKDAGNNSDPDQDASMQNRSKKPGNTEFDEDDLDF